MKSNKKMKKYDIDGSLPHQIHAPSFKGTGIEIEPPFENSFGVIIGDSKYTSPNSPLENWSDKTDPAIMSGDEWVHPTNDIGWNTSENRELLESKKQPQGYPFMHPTKDVSHGND
ncbi:DUF3905 domain-containing protein [Bacillus methanolicus]|uniref:DUF3905 domain-containing protein n=1 Tax=Bacillus methanolicus TaxID=1471 RepID=UPI00200DBFE0|nr:DUF3905 domain-containing protein [Bacillus methanolicus]UQD51500.1 DUF3905 domain-containing protein [Bacillus methanolicus]